MSSKLHVVEDSSLAGAVVIREGDDVQIPVIVTGVVSSLASPTQKFYKRNGTTDLNSTYFTGSPSVPTGSLDTILSATTIGSALKKGTYTLSVNATVDGVQQNVATISVIIKRRSEL